MTAALPEDLERRLLDHRAQAGSEPPPPRRAAVAAVLRRAARLPEVLLMTRVEHELDPWSGHVSFPGGTRSVEDRDLLQTAVRETREEVGLDLSRSARLLCQLAPVPAIARGRRLSMDITPFVFRLDRSPRFSLNEEAHEVFWLPLEQVVSGALDGSYEWSDGRQVRRLACWRFEGRIIWGLTHRMIGDLLAVFGERR
jgi:8-oxo-dGTP pyrophosphatase MutT (NUDIX family)